MEFRVIDGTAPVLSEKEFVSFREDYLTSDMRTNEVRLKYGLSKKQYSDITKIIREEEGIDCRPYSRAKHFYKFKDKWFILKTTKKDRKYFGSLPCSKFSEEDMKQIILHCKELEWNIDEIKDFIRSLN